MTTGTLDFMPTMNGFQKRPQHVIFAAISAEGVMLQDRFKAVFDNLDRDNECHIVALCKAISRDRDLSCCTHSR